MCLTVPERHLVGTKDFRLFWNCVNSFFLFIYIRKLAFFDDFWPLKRQKIAEALFILLVNWQLTLWQIFCQKSREFHVNSKQQDFLRERDSEMFVYFQRLTTYLVFPSHSIFPVKSSLFIFNVLTSFSLKNSIFLKNQLCLFPEFCRVFP